jgi:putative sigma-54 modulation protein
MNVIITGRNVDLTPALKKYAESKLNKFTKYLSTITEAVVTMDVHKRRHHVEVILKAGKQQITAESVTEELYASIDDVVGKLENQIKKMKGKRETVRKTNVRAKAVAQAAEAPAVTEESPEAGSITQRKRLAMKPMTPDEAVMQLEDSTMSFFPYMNAETGQINVVYKLANGNFGLIEPKIK